ncbi:MAG: 4-hydroxy-4-methyl-2-oxoglutarate aldolase [Rhodospirillales bacterium]|nr:4-hydroxy-4-methyl-2-oxoglutarate aldolase [Rhodospirillales bacterium]
MADFKRPAAELISDAAKISTATMHEAGGKIGALPSGIKPASPEFEVCGPAYPVAGPAGDNLWLHRAIADAKPGDVLVAYMEDHYEAGYWGEIMSTGAKAQKLGGLVIDGCVRDGAILPKVGFPVFARGFCMRGTGKDFNGKGSLGTALSIGNILIEPGDLVRGDFDGVVIVPQARIAEVNQKSNERDAKEQGVMERLRGGETSMEIYGWE